MHTFLRLSTAAMVLVGSASFGVDAATWTILPGAPTSQDTVFAETRTQDGCPTSAQVSMKDHRITVATRCDGVGVDAPTISRIRIGRLPEGTYQIDDTTFTVAPRAPGVQANDFSDLWWNPDESGWGLNIIQHGDGMIFATWFVYATDGSAAWYVIPGGKWLDASYFTGSVYRTTGPAPGTSPWPGATVQPAGTATLFFGIGGKLTATFTVDGNTITKQLVRQSF